MLSDKKKREMYDNFGDRGVNPNGFQSNPFAGSQFQRNPFGGSEFQFNYDSSFDDLFSNANGSPFGGGSFGSSSTFAEGSFQDIFSELGEMLSQKRRTKRGFPNSYGNRNTKPNTKQQNVIPSITYNLKISLEDLYNGCVKELRVRDKIHIDSRVIPIEKVFKIDIKRGWKAGTKIKFDASKDFPKKMVFVVEQLPHKYFERKDNDLVWKCHLTKSQIDKGVHVHIPLLDGEVFSFNTKDQNVKHGSKRYFEDLGMPVSKSNGKEFGDLVVKFEITPGP